MVKTLHSLEGAWVQSSVRELRSHMLPNMAKKKKKEREKSIKTVHLYMFN